MKRSSRISVGIALGLAALFAAGLVLYFLQALNEKFHFLSEHAQEFAAENEFRLLGALLIAVAPFCLLLQAVWWIGRKFKVPYFVLLILCLLLIVIAYLLPAYQFQGTLRG